MSNDTISNVERLLERYDLQAERASIADLKAKGLHTGSFNADGKFSNNDDLWAGATAAIELFGLAALIVIPEDGGEVSLAKIGAKDSQTAAFQKRGRTYLLYRTSIDVPPPSRWLGPGLYLKGKGGIPAPSGELARWIRRADEFGLEPLPEDVRIIEPIPKDEEPLSHGPAQRVSLAQVIEDGVKPLEYLYPDLVCKGKIHALQAPPHVGKTYVATGVAYHVAKAGGRVMWIDEENTPEEIAGLLQDLGTTAEDLEHILYYPAPGYKVEDAAQFRGLVDAVEPELVVWDNMASVLQRAGLNENLNDDVSAWYNEFAKPIRGKAATLILDHLSKAHDGGIYARGAGAKRAENQIMWTLSKPENFNRGKVGKIRLKLTKDKTARLSAETIEFEAGGMPAVFRKIEGPNLTGKLRATYDALEDGADFETWKSAAMAAGVSEATIYRHKTKLIDEHELVREDDGQFFRK